MIQKVKDLAATASTKTLLIVGVLAVATFFVIRHFTRSKKFKKLRRV